MSTYRPQKTNLEIHLDRLAEFECRVADKLSQASAWMNEGHCYLWSLPDTELADFLNALGPDRVAALMTDHGTLGTVLNGTLDRIASDNATTRAIVGAGREITLTGGVFSVVPVVPEEPNEVQ